MFTRELSRRADFAGVDPTSTAPISFAPFIVTNTLVVADEYHRKTTFYVITKKLSLTN